MPFRAPELTEMVPGVSREENVVPAAARPLDIDLLYYVHEENIPFHDGGRGRLFCGYAKVRIGQCAHDVCRETMIGGSTPTGMSCGLRKNTHKTMDEEAEEKSDDEEDEEEEDEEDDDEEDEEDEEVNRLMEDHNIDADAAKKVQDLMSEGLDEDDAVDLADEI